MNKIDGNRLAAILVEARGRLRLSQAQLGKQLGVSRQAVSLWESGRAIPQAQQVHAIEQLLGIELPSVGTPPPARQGTIQASDARGVRIAALRMSEVVTQLLREAVEAEAESEAEALAARARATMQAHAAQVAAAAQAATPTPAPRRRKAR